MTGMGYANQNKIFPNHIPSPLRARGANAPPRFRLTHSRRPRDFRSETTLRFPMVAQRGSLSQDPLGVSNADENAFRYVLNSPIVRSDPPGLVGGLYYGASFGLFFGQIGFVDLHCCRQSSFRRMRWMKFCVGSSPATLAVAIGFADLDPDSGCTPKAYEGCFIEGSIGFGVGVGCDCSCDWSWLLPRPITIPTTPLLPGFPGIPGIPSIPWYPGLLGLINPGPFPIDGTGFVTCATRECAVSFTLPGISVALCHYILLSDTEVGRCGVDLWGDCPPPRRDPIVAATPGQNEIFFCGLLCSHRGYTEHTKGFEECIYCCEDQGGNADGC
jgi:hypothetical protein